VANTVGRAGEAAAAEFLERSGYRILETNYRTVFGEVDIIALDAGVTVFVEVKTRSGAAYGSPFEAVTTTKQQKIRKVALYYMKKKKQELQVRFDVLSILSARGQTAAYTIEHIKDAF
jgi:putative endonuclease